MRIISTEKAPKAIGPYSQGIISGNMIFVSGQIAIDPVTNQFIDGDIGTQTKRSRSNIEAILSNAGSSKNKILKCTVYLTDLNMFNDFNNAYSDFFGEHKPARVTIEVSRLPKNALVEISAIAEL
jgi:2-iminobutanoate/2-iminopropanoate deaminase